MILPITQRRIDNFWKRVKKSKSCWLWAGWKDDVGYGVVRNGTNCEKMGVHRFSWIIHNGEIPKGLHVLHKCDNPPCVNPTHLFLGTHKENINDRIAKGRTRGGSMKGEANKGGGKLTANEVLDIRSRYSKGGIYQKELAAEYGVSQVMISRLILQKSWNHI